MWFSHKFFKYATAIILTLLIIYLLGKIEFFLSPFYRFVRTISGPLVATGIAYYILRPAVHFLDRFRLPRALSILITYAVVLTLIILFSSFAGSILSQQLASLLKELPGIIRIAQDMALEIINEPAFHDLPYQDVINQKVMEILSNLTQNLTKLIIGIITKVTNIGTTMLLVPFILFYFLKDDRKIVLNFLQYIPKKRLANVKKVFSDIDTALSSYIVGQMLVALFIGVMMFAGYMLIGLKYALILAIFAMITSLIPYFGPWIGVLPAIFVGLATNPLMALKALIVMLVVQQIDNNLISPYVVGRRLDIHPVTVMLLLLGGISIYGFIGLLLIIPIYAALRVTIKNLYTLYISKFEEKPPKNTTTG